MATNTYVALDKVTVSTATNTITFSSIPQTYTDLVLVSVTKSTTGNNTRLTLNNDGTSLYSNTSLGGTGSSAVSRRDSGVTYLRLDWDGYNQTTEFNVHITSVMNYTNTSVFKTVLTRSGSGPTGVDALVGLYRSTSAITRLDVIASTGNFDTGSTFSLYGIAASGVTPAAKATGGAIYSDDTYYYHVFGSTGTFTPLSSLTADVLVVAGGGGGGRIVAGGGGAGGLTYYASQSLTATGYTCTVGAGGAGSTTSGYSSGAQGGNSSFTGLTASVGGGAGGAINAGGGAGGSGGGAGGSNIAQSGGSATSGQGNSGGSRSADSNYEGSGGGGAGAAGSSNTATTGGNGGVGVTTYSSWGIATGTGENVSGTYYYSGGGGGGWSGAGATSANAGQGGYGGGGRGGFSNQTTTTDNAPVAGIATTGGGGGGAPNDFSGNNTNTYGANGGSGVVIIRYLKA